METNTTPDPQEVRLSDLYRVAYYRAIGLEMIRIDRTGNRCLFVFSRSRALDVAQLDWINERAQVEASRYAAMVRACKNLVHL
jgi:hypothetical protein